MSSRLTARIERLEQSPLAQRPVKNIWLNYGDDPDQAFADAAREWPGHDLRLIRWMNPEEGVNVAT